MQVTARWDGPSHPGTAAGRPATTGGRACATGCSGNGRACGSRSWRSAPAPSARAWGYGAEPEEARRIFDRFAEAGGNFVDCADAYQFGQAETLLGEFVAADRDHFVLATKYTLGAEPERRRLAHRQRPQEHGPLGRGEPEAARDRPHRPLLGPHGRRHDPDRGDRARLRGPGAGRQGPPRRPLRLPGLADRPGGDAGRAARLGPDRRHPGRVQPGRAHVRPRAAADGRGARPRGDRVVAAWAAACSPASTAAARPAG